MRWPIGTAKRVIPIEHHDTRHKRGHVCNAERTILQTHSHQRRMALSIRMTDTSKAIRPVSHPYGVLMLVLIVVCAAASAAEPLPAPTGIGESPVPAGAAGVATPPQSAAPPSLAEIVTALEALETTEGDIGKRLADAAWLDSQRTEIDADERVLAAVQRPAAASVDLIEELFAL